MKSSGLFKILLLILVAGMSGNLQALPGSAVNVSKMNGSQTESYIVVNPTNPLNIVAFSNEQTSNNTFRAFTTDGGATWTHSDINVGSACCDAQAVTFDNFGNLFLVYIDGGVSQINVIFSTNGGATFSAPITVGSGGIDQPSIAAGNGSLWVDWNQGGSMRVRGAPVTGLGMVGPWGPTQVPPGATGSFGGIAVGPGAAGSGKVMIVYQNPTGGEGPATISVNVDPDGLGAANFGSAIFVTNTNVGGFDFIPAQSGRSVDAESGLAWDGTGGPFNNRVYLVYTEETAPENNDTDILVRTSDNDGATWSAPIRVNDDPASPIRSQFNPSISMDEKTGTIGVTFHDCRNDNGVPGTGGTNSIANDDAQYFVTFSTNGGATWAANVQLSCGFSNDNAAGNGIDYGDYVGTDTFCGVVWGAWADNSNCTGDNPQGTLHQFDLYANALPFLPIDLGINKSDGGVSSSPGATITYTLSYSNTGRLSTGVVLTDSVPDNTTFSPADSTPGWSCTPDNNAGSVCTLNVGTLQGCGGANSATFAVIVDDPVPGGVTQISNTAGVSDDGTNGADGNPADNTSTDTTPLIDSPDVNITKTDGGTSVLPGGTVVYTLGYANTGTLDATGVAVHETVPANSTFNAGASTGTWSCVDGSPAGTPCDLIVGAFASGASDSVDFAVNADGPAAAGVDSINNTATISMDDPDPTPDDNTASDSTSLDAAPDYSITKDDGGVDVVPGGTVVYTLNYTNGGNQNGTGVVLTETVPAGTTFNSGSSSPGWVCVPNNNQGSVCTLVIGALNAGSGGSANFAVTAGNPAPAGQESIANTASIADDLSNGPDPTPGNNSASDTTLITAAPDLSITKDDGNVTADPLDVVVYTLNYSNAGNQNASGVTITETVPDGSAFDPASSTAGWVCVPNGSAGSTCTLAVGAVAGNGGSGSASFGVIVQDPPGVTELLNTASIADDGTGGPDPNPGDNSTSDNTPITVNNCLFCDDFEDGVLQPSGVWTYIKNITPWSESGGTLIATSFKKTSAIATPIFAGCLNCAVESAMQIAGNGRVSLFGWYVDKRNNVELMMNASGGKWIYRQRVAGKSVKKIKVPAVINTGQQYIARIVFDGTNFIVTIDGTQILSTPATAVSGTVGYRVRSTTGTFGYIDVR